MISLVMVLLLVLAVSQIFRVTTTTIGKGNATSEVIRGLDAARIALQIDFSGTDAISYSGFTDKTGILPADRQPAIIISSTSIPAFFGPRDLEGDNDYDPPPPFGTGALPFGTGVDTLDSNNDGIDDLVLGPYNTGRRWFRTDSISFFTGGHNESQKNLDPSRGGFYGDTTSDESWVWYGHARVYDGQGELNTNSTNQYPLPGEGDASTNPHNFFASQFVLLRTPILLKGQQTLQGATETTVLSDGGTPVLHLRPDTWDPQDPTANLLYPSGELDLSPLMAFGSFAAWMNTNAPATPPFTNQPYLPTPNTYGIEDSRTDIAGVTADQYRQRLAEAQRHEPPGLADANGPLHFASAAPRAASPETWYNRLFARTNGNAENQNAGRFWINPLVLKPLDAGEVSQASSYLLGGATQFIVEYAGDFLTQSIVGATTANAPDGIIDFTIDSTGTRHVRFYGMPRDVDGRRAYLPTGVTYLIPGPAALSETVPLPAPLPDSNSLLVSTDTRPLADFVLAANGMTVDSGFPFEKRLPGEYNASDSVSGRSNIADYEQAYLNGDITDWTYLAAWGPGDFDANLYPTTTHASTFESAGVPLPLRPSLIRVIVQGIDSRERLEEPISMELIFRVPAE